jgi:MarR family 2-MHQ and catechol resistance regulon transcriptional repressor
MKTAITPSPVATRRPPAPQSAALKLFVVLSRAHSAVVKHVEKDVAASGFTFTEWGILEVLYHKGPLLLGDVQRRILVSSGGITYLVDRLEKRGLLERQACPSDRRARYAVLTPEGERVMREMFAGHQRQIEEAMAGLTASEQRECAKLLKELGKRAAGLEDDSQPA